MHPSKADSIRGHNAKLKRMTAHYGAANPSQYHMARENQPKPDGPEEAVGYGADEAGATARSDRPARRTAPGNAVATYKRGGKVRKRAAGGPVQSRGKRGKGPTNISINIAPASPPTGASGLPMGANPAMPPMPPPGAGAPPPGAGGPPGIPPGAAGAMGGPLGQLALQQKAAGLIPRKRGGRVHHSDEAEDRKLVKRMVKHDALTGKHRGGHVERARGGSILKGAGAESGEGRLARNRHMDHKLRPTRGIEG